MMIQISGDYGDTKADDIFWPLQKKLNDSFSKYIVDVYFNTLVMFAIVFRVSGKALDFGSEGPERMKYVKKDSKITIDLVFPESSWRRIDSETVKNHVAAELRKTIRIMLEKADKLGEVQNLEEFENHVDKAISEFLDN